MPGIMNKLAVYVEKTENHRGTTRLVKSMFRDLPRKIQDLS